MTSSNSHARTKAQAVSEMLAPKVGSEVGASAWVEMSQNRIDAFAQTTGDDQWIHVDRDRAQAGPFGGTIAHGFLTLSMTSVLLGQIPIDVGKPTVRINYGLNKVRFLRPVMAGSQVRARVRLISLTPVGDALQIERAVTIETMGSPEPVMYAEMLSRYYY